MPVDELAELRMRAGSAVRTRLDEFRRTWKEGNDRDIFKELAFCLFTPQSKARVCWAAVESLDGSSLLWDGDAGEISAAIRRVRFHNTKAKRVVAARRRFVSGGRCTLKEELSRLETPFLMREWLVENVNGLGYKEASHLLRNLGHGEDLAILDRHILRNLVRFGVTDAVPKHLSRAKYLKVEGAMRVFSRRSRIPMDELDLLLWYREAGEVFK